MVVAPPSPVRVPDRRAVLGDDPLVAVNELRVADRGHQTGELVRVPRVVLVGRRDEAGAGRRQRQRALEVAVEPAPAVRPRQHEPRVVADHLAHLGDPLGPRAVVADDAQPVRLGLRADRLDLVAEQVDRRLERRHADRHARRAGQRLGQRRHRDPREVLLSERASGEARAQPQLDRRAVAAGGDPGEAPEARPVRGGLARGAQQVEPRHAVGHHRLGLAVDHQRELVDPVAGREAGAADEQRGAGADRQLRRERCVEADVQGACERTLPP